eukprot:IDg13782t1
MHCAPLHCCCHCTGAPVPHCSVIYAVPLAVVDGPAGTRTKRSWTFDVALPCGQQWWAALVKIAHVIRMACGSVIACGVLASAYICDGCGVHSRDMRHATRACKNASVAPAMLRAISIRAAPSPPPRLNIARPSNALQSRRLDVADALKFKLEFIRRAPGALHPAAPSFLHRLLYTQAAGPFVLMDGCATRARTFNPCARLIPQNKYRQASQRLLCAPARTEHRRSTACPPAYHSASCITKRVPHHTRRATDISARAVPSLIAAELLQTRTTPSTLTMVNSSALLPPSPGVASRLVQIGCGVVGHAYAQAFADAGHDVFGVEASRSRMEQLADAYPMRHVSEDLSDIEHVDFILLSINTPLDPATGALSMRYLWSSVENVTALLRTSPDALVVVRSTVTLGFCAEYRTALGERLGAQPRICFQPEFLRAKSALSDARAPWHVVLGADDASEVSDYAAFQRQFVDASRISICTIDEAEVMKIFHNSYNAMKISYFNHAARLCNSMEGKNIDPERTFRLLASTCEGLLNPLYGLTPGHAYYGSCLPKDSAELAHMEERSGLPERLFASVVAVNDAVRADDTEEVIHGDNHVDSAFFHTATATYSPKTPSKTPSPLDGPTFINAACHSTRELWVTWKPLGKRADAANKCSLSIVEIHAAGSHASFFPSARHPAHVDRALSEPKTERAVCAGASACAGARPLQ